MIVDDRRLRAGGYHIGRDKGEERKIPSRRRVQDAVGETKQ